MKPPGNLRVVPARATRLQSWRPTLGRSVRLLREFRYEQPDPARFYTAIAEDSVAQLSHYVELRGASFLDVGGGPGYFRDAFSEAGATYFSLDSDVGELAGLGTIADGTVIGSGMELPFRTDSLDVCYSSNVLEHVPEPWRMAEEGPCDSARRHRVRQLHHLVGAVGRSRDLALALPRRPPGPASLRPPVRPCAQEQVR